MGHETNSFSTAVVFYVYMARFWKQRGYSGGFCERLLEASPMTNRVNASWLQEEPITDEFQAHQ